MTELLVLLDNREVGIIRQQRGRARFEYADSWREAPGAYPLSLSMPMAAREHEPAAVEPFLWGLLPDNDVILARWAQQFQVSARNAVALLSHVGADCAGAVQLVPPERHAEFSASAELHVDWLSEAQIAVRLRTLQEDASAWRSPGDVGQFSLAGAQPKTAFLFDGTRWGIPSGRTPTTHIFKPPAAGFDGHAQNEHLCLAVARALGLPAAHSQVRTFDGVPTIVVERYDRVRTGEQVHRVHQEDFCQALRIHPAKKHQNQGGPGPVQIVELLRANASGAHRSDERGAPTAADEDIATFVDALILNFLLGGTDAHAKNYSLLIGGGGLVRLAPLYDIASLLAYPDLREDKARLAMKIGSRYRLRKIALTDWRELAAQLRIDPDRVVARLQSMAAQIPDVIADEARALHKSGLNHPVVQRMVDMLSERARRITES
jgi:serine/threonine-protein kinase HipA